ncbi:MAG: molybdopterin-dependent oxidoreductase [Nitrososphaerales archaeon]
MKKREFISKTSEQNEKVSRRFFLKLATFSSASFVIASTFFGLGKDFFKSPLVPGESSSLEVEESFVGTACWIGKQDCGMFARVIGGRVVKLEGDPNNPRNRGKLCPKGVAQIIALYSPYRIKSPLKRVNEKGIPGKWIEVSWDEALDIISKKLKEIMERNPKLIIWQKGRSKQESIYDRAFVGVLGATSIGHGAYCSDAGYRACEYTVGQHGVLHPDFRYCNYLISWGWNITNAGGNKLCWITWNSELVSARERGMKVILLDPRRDGGGPHIDDWLPIRPGTDLAFWLAIANVLVDKNYIDTEFLKKYTNAPFLVKENGYFLKVEEKEQMWDLSDNKYKPYDVVVKPALEGVFVTEDGNLRPAFQVFKEQISIYTPEWAASITGVPADTIRRIAIELGENARIGSKVIVDGVEVPYRPVAVMAYHISQQEMGFQAVRACLLVFMLLGAIGAAGGVHIDFLTKPSIDKRFESWEKVEVKSNTDFTLSSKYFPINSKNPSLIARVMLNPDKYGVKEVPEVIIIHMANPLLSFTDQPILIEAYRRLKFMIVISPWLSETADYFADIVLPTTTLDKTEGPFSAKTPYEDGYIARIAPVKPLFKSKDEPDIYAAICEKLGLLNKFINEIVKELGIKEEYRDQLLKGYRDGKFSFAIVDAWAKSKGIDGGGKYFEEKGTWYVGKIPAKIRYPSAWDKPFLGIRLRLYGEGLRRMQDEMKKMGLSEIYWRDYTPLPIWRSPTMENSPPEYDLYLVSYKKIEYKQSRATFVPLLAELEPEQRIVLNSMSAKMRGIRDGDWVFVESHNALSGETRRIKVRALLREGIRPDVVAMSHHYGFWVDPWAAERGPTPNYLYYTEEGYVTNTADQSFHVKVKVWKAEGD